MAEEDPTSVKNESDDSELLALREKDVQYYAAGYNAWFNTSLEHDKSLLTLSAAGIGLLVGLLNASTDISAAGLILNIASIICFITSLFSVLYIFKHNRSHIIEVLNGEASSSPVLKTLDTVAILSFGLGVLLAAILGISIAVQTYIRKEIAMSNEHKSRPGIGNDSFERFSSLKPQGSLEKSFTGMSAFKPAPAKPAESSSTPSQPTGQGSSNTSTGK